MAAATVMTQSHSEMMGWVLLGIYVAEITVINR